MLSPVKILIAYRSEHNPEFKIDVTWKIYLSILEISKYIYIINRAYSPLDRTYKPIHFEHICQKWTCRGQLIIHSPKHRKERQSQTLIDTPRQNVLFGKVYTYQIPRQIVQSDICRECSSSEISVGGELVQHISMIYLRCINIFILSTYS